MALCKQRRCIYGCVYYPGSNNSGWQVRGHLELPTGEKLEKPLVFGKWDEAMYAEMPDNTQRLLWQKSEPPPDPTRCAHLQSSLSRDHEQIEIIRSFVGHMERAGPSLTALACCCRYNLTKWAIQLNEITPGLEKKLAPTDCRLRPDQHHLELGQYDQVTPCFHVLNALAFVAGQGLLGDTSDKNTFLCFWHPLMPI